MDLLNGASFRRLEGALHAASMRQQVLANNIANIDTPNFKRSDVAFEEMLSQAMGTNGAKKLMLRKTDPRHIPAGSSANPAPSVVTEDATVMNNNRNNVDIDKEMALVAENQLRYNAYIQSVNHQVKMMRTGIEGRG